MAKQTEMHPAEKAQGIQSAVMSEKPAEVVKKDNPKLTKMVDKDLEDAKNALEDSKMHVARMSDRLLKVQKISAAKKGEAGKDYLAIVDAELEKRNQK